MVLIRNDGPPLARGNTRTIPRRTYKKLNIFALDTDPEIAALYANDMHVSKMTTETAQILCTVTRQRTSVNTEMFPEYMDILPMGNIPISILESRYRIPNVRPDLYKSTHKNHPSVIWASSGASEYLWLHNYFLALGEQYRLRFGKVHASITKLATILSIIPNTFVERGYNARPITVVASPTIVDKYYRSWRETRRNVNLRDLDLFENVGGDRIPEIEHTWPNAVEMYREYYCVDKFNIGKWTNVSIPHWYKEYHEARGATEVVRTRRVRGNNVETRFMEYP